MSVEILTKYHLELLSLTGGGKGSSESTLVRIVREHMSWLLFPQYKAEIIQPHIFGAIVMINNLVYLIQLTTGSPCTSQNRLQATFDIKSLLKLD